MVNTFLKQTKQTAVDQAQKAARQLAQEPFEIVKSALPVGLKPNEEEDNSNLVSEMIESGNTQLKEPVDEEAVKAQTNKRLQELEEEIKRISDERKGKEEEWKKAQKTSMQPEQPNQEQFIEPQGKRKRGFMGGAANKKQGTKEMGKHMSG